MNNYSFNSEKYNIRLAGEKVLNGNIPIDDYALYLQNINHLCQSVNNLLNPGHELDIQINSNIEKGSIINTISFAIRGVGLFTGTPYLYSVEDILTSIGFLEKGIGLIQLLVEKKDSEIESVIDIDDRHVRVNFKGKNVGKNYIETTKEVINLCRDKYVRGNLEKTTEILSKEGYEKIGFKRTKDNAYNYIDKNNIIHLRSNDNVEMQLNVKVYSTVVDIENITLNKLDNKWKFKENDQPAYWAFVKDEKFKEDIRKNGIKPPFSLKVQIKQTDTYSGNRVIQVEKEIIKVDQINDSPV